MWMSMNNTNNQNNATEWDLVVVGGGPSGMMAAGRAAELGARVLLVEKNDSLGKKLLITGGGRCNVTNSEFDTRILLEKFKENGKFLFSPFSEYGVKETLDFFHKRGMPTKVENEKRTFPLSNTSQTVLDVLVTYINEGKVTVYSNVEVMEFLTDFDTSSNSNDNIPIDTQNKIRAIKTKDGKIIKARNFVLATGGKSRPETGSTGAGFIWAKKMGHTVIEPSASLVPLKLVTNWTKGAGKDLSGVSLSDAKITVLQNNTKQGKPTKGKILFTHVGVSGPAILNTSKDIGELLKYGEVFLSIDVLPQIDQARLDTALNTLFRTEINKKLKNCLGMIGNISNKVTDIQKDLPTNIQNDTLTLPSALIKTIIEISGVDGDTPAHSITKEMRKKILTVIKGMTIQVDSLLGTDKAIVTSGGVTLTEIDPKTMQSKIYSNLYLIGDMLHIDRPSGGYSLQLCWTTGYVAGNNIGKQSLNQ